MQKLTIIQTPVRFYPAIGGVENHVYYLSQELVKLGHIVTVICANTQNSPEKTYFYKGIKVRLLHSWFKITNTNITLSLPFALFNEQFDIIHTHMPTPWTCDWSILIAKMKGKKSILTIHNDMQKSGFFSKLLTDLYLHTLFRLTLYLTDQIIIVNPDWEQSFKYTKSLIAPYKNKVTIVPNGVDISLFKPVAPKKENTILFVSVLDKHHVFKGFSYLLKAMKNIVIKIPSVKLWVIGEGELRNVYEKETEKKGLKNSVIFLGKKTQDELPAYYSESSVFVLPSTDTEGFGIVLLESLACGTPVVTTEVVGIRDEIKLYGIGSVVQSKNADELGESVVKLLKEKSIRKTTEKEAQDYVYNNYRWSLIAEKITSIYYQNLL